MSAPLDARDLVVVRGVGRRAVRVLDGASLAVEAGEVVLLEGPSGSGKTTLLLVAAGLLTPTSGGVTVAGLELGRASQSARRALRAKAVGFVFQRANLLERLTVRENVELAGFLAGRSPAEVRSDVDSLLEALGIGHLAERRPDALSGGEEHRAAVARALVHRPALVLADEPTGNLDADSGAAVAEALAGLARDRGAAVLVATHDARLYRIADRRAVLDQGRIRPAGSSP
jgi:ABC-type lipoprotein export system ATPase subunit